MADFQPENASPRLLVVSDLSDMFIPLRSGFLVDPAESRLVQCLTAANSPGRRLKAYWTCCLISWKGNQTVLGVL